ncbi:uncharacterized protein N7484_007444 [Penicillium longicatenatum]|uniref:uncharacterized protein n=1 Tax=Penicillium longicatenatum TaxID=1561947 RepID=UPI0025495A32|nr:uncharacterized protein N7484_007444 [Penicillium longicatenatum]KAJ5639582.1 hypothetical protein N7484_007444 [Penicillium longicatenatum]
MEMSMATTTSASMDMSSTATSSAATSSSSTSSMDMGGSSCKISMLWNWNTVDSCFIAESWHITSKGMFAGSCIGVICLVICLEFLRRLGKEYDRFLLRQHELRAAMVGSETSVEASCLRSKPLAFTPSVLQQSLRALLHVAQFAVAYFVML